MVDAGMNERRAGPAPGVQKVRLKDVQFTDLYVGAGGSFRILDHDGSVLQVDRAILSDAAEFHSRLMSTSENEQEFFIDHDDIRYRVSRIDDIVETSHHVRRAVYPIPELGSLGLPKQLIREFARRGEGHGLILISGATGNGKTTTAGSILQEYLCHYGGVGVTIEDPPELYLSGAHGERGWCYQLKVNRDVSVSTALASALRYNPRYILPGEVRRPHEAEQVIRAAINGHLVITTIHAGSPIEALQALLKLAGSVEDPGLMNSILADGLAGSIHQKLKKRPLEGGGWDIRPVVTSLFPNASVRSQIKSGNFSNLGDEIDRQAKRMERGDKPTEEL